MRGISNCKFIGGSQDGKILEIISLHCRKRLCIESSTWFSKAKDAVKIVKGHSKYKDPDWFQSLCYVYEKQPKKKNDKFIVYQLIETRNIHRCEKYLENKQRMCLHEAQPGKKYCSTHKVS
ncbi:CCCH zinc finger protein [Candidatus Uabimicrobium amorphum]|uniref:Zinc finger CCCH-type TRM13 domain-containing protein n=1 Tax=Uabimicrobium amorphum TaxID=2596890 RepID=A0A5S9F2P9_UABAM|nr:CCCH zinc finger protein [Candidatus Uabimicrobium amorphum]BBM83343.1 hypothetical protein UABAM_01695 [Candidatus Uabimicrobium amorphum]